jgi:hypothetical protein
MPCGILPVMRIKLEENLKKTTELPYSNPRDSRQQSPHVGVGFMRMLGQQTGIIQSRADMNFVFLA